MYIEVNLGKCYKNAIKICKLSKYQEKNGTLANKIE